VSQTPLQAIQTYKYKQSHGAMIANFPPLPSGIDNVIASKISCSSEKQDPSDVPPNNLKATSNLPATNANSSDSVHETSYIKPDVMQSSREHPIHTSSM
jgi:hypothetical protein